MSKLHLLVAWSATGYNFAQNSVSFSVSMSSNSSVKGKSERDECFLSAFSGYRNNATSPSGHLLSFESWRERGN